MSNTRVTDKILEKPYFSRVGIMQEIIYAMAMSRATLNIKSSAHACMERSFLYLMSWGEARDREKPEVFEGRKANGRFFAGGFGII